jgi:hypothetical protein
MIVSARIAELEQQLATAQGQAQENYRLLGIANAGRETAEEAVTRLTAERDNAVRELAAERESRENVINSEVIQRLAAAGARPIRRDPVATEGNGNDNSAAGIAARWAAMEEGPAKHEFFKANKMAIYQAQGAAKAEQPAN